MRQTLAFLAVSLALAYPAVAQINNPVPDAAAAAQAAQAKATADAAAQAAADALAASQAAQTSAAGAVKSVNGTAPAANGNVAVPVPTASTVTPPSVSDSGTVGTMTTMYALANHTHASKARKDRVLVPAGQVFDVVFSTPFTAGTAPLCVVVAETTRGDTNVVNAQVDGVTTSTGFRIRITRTAITVASLLGLNILSIPTQIATYAHYICIEP